jgi:type IV fimbrial biogenesis protein FimT
LPVSGHFAQFSGMPPWSRLSILALPDKEVPDMAQKHRGFTLYELLITIMLVAILATLSLPSFSRALAKNRQSIEINALFHAIHLARKESIRRKHVVSLCPSHDGETCRPGMDWSSGWILFNNADQDSPPQVDRDEFVILRHPVDPSFRVTANRRAFTLRATHKRATNGTLVVCDVEDRIAPKALVISYTGRPRVAAQRPGGGPWLCAD